MGKKTDLPAMPFYVGDWLKCPEVRALQLDYRALWFDLICYLWESTERGVMIKPNGNPYTDNEIIRMVGLDNQNTGNWLTSILESGVCSRRETDGAIFSRRMVKDEHIRAIRRETGLKGGNPNLKNKKNTNILVNQKSNQNTEDENEDEDENTITGESKKKGVQGDVPVWAVDFKNYNPDIVYPFEYAEFGEAWDLWIAYRRERKSKKYGKIGEQAQLSQLGNSTNRNLQTALEAIRNSIASGWAGIHVPDNNNQNGKKNQSPSEVYNEIRDGVSAFCKENPGFNG